MPELSPHGPKSRRARAAWIAAVALGVLALLTAGAYQWLLPGLSSARSEPSAVEVGVATWLLHHSVPRAERSRMNPLGGDAADITVGRNLFAEHCEICHAYGGDGKTAIGAGTFPRPPELKALVGALSDGELFYHIRNGIRNTAMPAWDLPDRQLWQLVAYLRRLPVVASLTPAPATPAAPGGHFVGSKDCAGCHQEIYSRWRKTRMANVVQDPRERPDAIIPDFSKADPLLTFGKDDVALVYGSVWKQRYFKKLGNDYYPLAAQWDINHKQWRPYHVADNTDWWAPLYPDPGDNSKRPTGPLCDGCHSVGYNIADNSVAEWNVGCERCHGTGSDHADHPARTNILNPGKMGYVDASDTCISCHSQGQPLGNPIKGKYYDWPVGYAPGSRLSEYWKLEEHQLGTLTFTHYPDGTAHKNRMQGNDFVQSLMYARGVTCFSCHDPHGSDNEAMLRKPAKDICGTCHGPNSQNGPHGASIEAHTHHAKDSPGSQCVACHMPKIEQTIADINVSSHTFHFVTPGQTDTLKIPNACNVCHRDKSTEWARSALSSWNDRSVWRVAN
jgi:predicted CXXCH cytochrome family protein